jgi:hypothetical protein
VNTGPAPIPPNLGAPNHGVPAGPKTTSAAATASLVLSLVGFFCPPMFIGSIAAVLLGIVAVFDIRSSRGAKSGNGLAATGIALGTITTLGWAALIVLAMATSKPSRPTRSPPIYLPPTYTAPYPAPYPTGTTPGPIKPQMTRDMRTIETSVGKVTVVDIGAEAPTLAAELQTQRARAAGLKQTLVLQTTSTTCRPCQGVAASLNDPKMQTALAGVRLVRVDVQDFGDELDAIGIPHDVIPGFFLLDGRLAPVDGVHGGEWDDDTADNIAPVLGGFVRGTLTTRREPWKKRPTAPRPGGTML